MGLLIWKHMLIMFIHIYLLQKKSILSESAMVKLYGANRIKATWKEKA
jgi:hypothetical protein